MSDKDKLSDLPKLLKNIVPYLDDKKVHSVSFDLKSTDGHWTIHQFKLDSKL